MGRQTKRGEPCAPSVYLNIIKLSIVSGSWEIFKRKFSKNRKSSRKMRYASIQTTAAFRHDFEPEKWTVVERILKSITCHEGL